MRNAGRVVACILALAAATAQAQTTSITLEDNDWILSLGGLTGNRETSSAGTSAAFRRTGESDNLYQAWWWYRGAGDTREYALSNQIEAEPLGGGAIRLVYREPVAGVPDALEFEIVLALTGVDDTRGYAVADWTVTNLSAGSMEVRFYFYIDYDLLGSPSNDAGLLETFGADYARIRATKDGTSHHAYLVADGGPVTRWAIRTYSQIVTQLADANPDDLGNATSPFSPADFTGALQRTFTLPAGGSLSGRDGMGINEIPPQAGADTLEVTSLTTVDAGSPFDVTVEVLDGAGNRRTDFTGTVTFTSSDPLATLPADYTFTPSDAGIRTFTGGATLRTSDTQWIEVTETTDAVEPGIQTGIVVSPGPADHLVVSGIGSPRPSGSPASVSVEARDAWGNRATAYTGTIRFTSSDPSATLPADHAFDGGDGGLVTLVDAVVLRDFGTHWVRAHDLADATIFGEQTGIVVEPVLLPGVQRQYRFWAEDGFVLSDESMPGSGYRDERVTLRVGVEATGDWGVDVGPATYAPIGQTLPDRATVTGSYTDLAESDGNVQAFTEGTQGNRWVIGHNVPHHTWHFGNLPGTGPFTLCLEAATTGEPFDMGWSSGGEPIWPAAWRISDTDPTVRCFDLSAAGYAGGLLNVTFIDVDRSNADDIEDTFTFDRVWVESDGGGGGDQVHFGLEWDTAPDFSAATQVWSTAMWTDPAVPDGSSLAAALLSGTDVPQIAVQSRPAAVENQVGLASGEQGEWAFYVVLPDQTGDHYFRVVVTDGAGNRVGLFDDYEVPIVIEITEPAPPLVTALEQRALVAAIPPGGLVSTATPTFEAQLSEPRGREMSLEIEARQAGTSFTGTATATLSPVASGAWGSIDHPALADGGWRWQARAVAPGGLSSPWVAFGGGDPATPDLVIDTTPPQVTLTAPIAGQTLVAGAPVGLSWETVDANPDRVDLHYSADGGGSWTPIATGIADTGTYDWTVPSVDTTLFRIRVTATDAVSLTGTFTSGDMTVVPARVRLVPAVTSAVAGDQVAVDIRVEDLGGALVPTARLVSISVNGSATFPATDLSGASGVGTASVSGTTAASGTASITVTSSVAETVDLSIDSGSVPGPNPGASITFGPGPAATFSVYGLSSPRTAGIAGSLTVEALDGYGNRATGFSGTVSFTSSDGAATLPGAYAFTAGDAGLRTFTGVVLTTAGTQSITATSGGVSGSQTGIVVEPAAPDHLVVSGISSPRTAGESASVTVEVRDEFANRVTGYTGGVSFASSDGAATLPNPVSFSTGDAGIRTFTDGVVLRTTGTHSVTATGDGGIIGAQTGIEVGPAAPSTLRLTGLSSPRAAGAVGAVTVEVLDTLGNRVTDFIGTVTLSSEDPAASLPPAHAFEPDDQGLHVFSPVTLVTAGTWWVRAEGGGLEGSHDDVTVEPAAAWAAEVTGPAGAISGTSPTLSVQLHDAYGNAAPEARSITLEVRDAEDAVISATSLSGASGVGTGTVTGTTDAGGSATVALSFEGAGSVRLCAFGTGLDGGERCHVVTFSAGPPDHITLEAAAGTAEAGSAVTLDLQVVDALGNPAAATVSVSLAVDGSGVLDGTAGTTSLTTTTAGAATVAVSNQVAETVSITVTSATLDGDALPATTPHDSATVVFVPGPADHVVATAPSEGVAGTPVTIGAQLVDVFGNAVSEAVGVCAAATGSPGAEPAMSPECDTTGAATGRTSFDLLATRAEAVTVSLSTTGLPGSGVRDGSVVIDIRPAASYALRFSPLSQSALACTEATVGIVVVDAYDNPSPAEIEVTLVADAAEIVSTDLGQATPTPATEVTGVTPASGTLDVVLTSDAATTATLAWSSGDLDGDPDFAEVLFEVGGVDAARSTVTTSTPQIEAGRGEARIRVTPRDGCDLFVGPDQDVSLGTTTGDLSTVVDLGDGTYEAILTMSSCPTTARIEATVNGVTLDAFVEVDSVCPQVDTDSPVVIDTPGADTLEACAAGDEWAVLVVEPVDPDGFPLPAGRAVTIDSDPPYLVAGEVEEVTADGLFYFVEVGSDRCGSDPRPVVVRVDGVALETAPTLTFLCPAVVDSGITLTADPAVAAAGGEERAAVRVQALDRCGNPAFGRPVALTMLRDELGPVVEGDGTTGDGLGTLSDGAAIFQVGAARAGITGVAVTVDGTTRHSPSDLLTFTLPQVLEVDLSTTVADAVPGQTIRFVATFSIAPIYDGTVVDLRVVPMAQNLEVIGVPADGIALDHVAPDAPVVLTLDAHVGMAGEPARLRLDVTYRPEADAEAGSQTARSPERVIRVRGVATGDGCECTNAGGGPGAPAWMLLLALSLFVLRRRSRRRAEVGASG